VLLMDQRGHGLRTRCPGDVSCGAFVGDVVDVLDEVVPGQRCVLVGQSMGAHTAFLTAAARPDLVDRLVTPEGLMPRFDADIMERTIVEVHGALGRVGDARGAHARGLCRARNVFRRGQG